MSKKDAYYFSHDSNARNDEKILAVRMRHGAEGYGIYFMIIERLLESTNYMSIKDYNIIAFDLRVSAEKVKSIVEDFELFTMSDDGKKFYSTSLNKRMIPLDNLREQRRQAGLKSAEKRKKKKLEKQTVNNDHSTTVQRPLGKNPTKERKGKESKGKEREKNKQKENDGRALDFLKINSPSRFETEFLMRHYKKIKNKKKFVEDFNDTVDQEGLEYDERKLFGRLGKYARNWIENQDKYGAKQENTSTRPKYFN